MRAGLDEAASWGLFCLLDRHAGERLGAEVAVSLLNVRTQTMGFPDATISRGRLRPGQNVSIKNSPSGTSSSPLSVAMIARGLAENLDQAQLDLDNVKDAGRRV